MANNRDFPITNMHFYHAVELFRVHRVRLQVAFFAAVLIATLPSQHARAEQSQLDDRDTSTALDVVFWNGARLAEVKTKLAEDDNAFKSEIKRLKKAVKKARRRGPYSVVNKSELPPSGDKHDYMSYSRYWWPDPEKEDGLPYIRHDGKVNRPMVDRGDRNKIGDLMDDIVPLGLASYLLDDEKAGKHAAELLRVWFLDEATRMNPHMNYGQAVLGRAEGRGVGILDTRGFIWMLDAIGLLDTAGALSDDEIDGLKSWFNEYLDWLQTSKLALDELKAKNNHGSWFAAQVSRIALFVGKPEVARAIATDVVTRRIPNQIAEDGSQPYELERTKSEHYSLFNLAALTVVARIGDRVGVDVWESDLRKAAGYLAKFAVESEEWPHEQMGKVQFSLAEAGALTLLAQQYDDESIRKLFKSKNIKDDSLNFVELQFER